MRYVYVVTTPGGYEGHRSYDMKRGKTDSAKGVPFSSARLYVRQADAERAAGIIRGARVARAHVVEE